MKLDSPCHHCQDRTPTCHADCARYASFDAECERIRQERYQTKAYKGETPGIKAALDKRQYRIKQGRK